jgi:type IV secretion system protein VirD4
MKNYAGHRLSPWLGHIMVSRQETPRPLLTPGEVMQLPPGEQLVLMSGCPPLRAKKARYFEDRRFTERVLPPPQPGGTPAPVAADEWSALPLRRPPEAQAAEVHQEGEDTANSGLRRVPDLREHVARTVHWRKRSPRTWIAASSETAMTKHRTSGTAAWHAINIARPYNSH